MTEQLQLRTAKARRCEDFFFRLGGQRRLCPERRWPRTHPSFSSRLRAFAVRFCFCIFFGLSVACGYAPVRGQVAGGLRVAAVRNATAQAEAGGLFAEAFRVELAGRGQLDPDGAQSPELLLQIITLGSLPSGSAGEGAASFRLNAVLAMKVGEYEDTVRASEDYIAGIDVLGTEANRRAALRRLARAAAREAIERYDVAERLK
jgi:hypothetical protein